MAPPEKVFRAWGEKEIWWTQISQIRGVVDDLVAAVVFLFQLFVFQPLERIEICGVKHEGVVRLEMP